VVNSTEHKHSSTWEYFSDDATFEWCNECCNVAALLPDSLLKSCLLQRLSI